MIEFKNVLSLFDGISCCQIALNRSGIKYENYYASEIDKYAMKITQHNYPNTIQLGDARNIKGAFLPQIDLICGGSPCTDISISKKNRQGLYGEHSSLFWEYVRILEEVKPKYFILENVASMSQETKRIITTTLKVEPIMIDAAIVSAQRRKRFFWTNIPVYELPIDRGIVLKDIIEEFVDDKYFLSEKMLNYFDKKTQKSRELNQGFIFKPKDEMDKSNTLLSKEDQRIVSTFIIDNSKLSQGYRVYDIDGKSVTLSANGGGLGAKTGLYHIPHGYKKEKITMEDKYPTLHTQDPRSNHLIVLDRDESTPEILSVKSAALRGRHIATGKRKDKIYSDTQQMLEIGDEKSNCLTSVCKDSLLSITVTQLGNSNKFGNDTNDSEKSHTLRASRPDGVILNDRIRKLTPLECERLQGVPDNYTNCGVSDTQRYKCLGNAFNVDVVAHILNYIDKEQPTNALMEL